MWDTAGQERFSALVPLYLSGASVIILVYDVTKQYTFNRIRDHWIPFIRTNLRMDADDKLPMMYLIGNKIDCEREVSETDGKELADEFGMGFVEVSAKTGENTKTIMEIIADYADEQVVKDADNVRKIRISESDNTRQQGCSGYYANC